MFGFSCFFFFQAEDGIRDLVRSRGLGDVYKRQGEHRDAAGNFGDFPRQLCSFGNVTLEPGSTLDGLSLIHI